ncbi:MAG: hypothetical protein IKV88_06750, partial [Clostridia bacterium]|nr:hypothetical protein [Clostridia bacterium]
FNNTDVILISILCDFKAVSIYAIYSIFFTQMQTFISSVVSSFNYALGQMFHTDRQSFDKVFSIYESLYVMITFIIYTLMAVFLLPLIQIYTKGINDADYVSSYLVILFVIMNLLANGKIPSTNVIEYSGGFERTRSHAIWEMAINIVVSVIAIIYIGVCGAIIGTIAALLYRGVITNYYSNKIVLGRKQMCTYKTWIINGSVFFAVILVLYVDTFMGLSFSKLILYGMIHSVWIIGLYVVANLVFNKSVFKNIIELYREKKRI